MTKEKEHIHQSVGNMNGDLDMLEGLYFCRTKYGMAHPQTVTDTQIVWHLDLQNPGLKWAEILVKGNEYWYSLKEIKFVLEEN